MADLSSEVLAFATGTYTVTRGDGPGAYDPTTGYFVADSTTEVEVVAAVFPVTGRELQQLPEGMRSKEVRQVFTTVALRASAPLQQPDVIEIDGEDWLVKVVHDWNASGKFWQSFVAKVQED